LKLDVQVVGASIDKPAANEKWAQKYGLRMPLIGKTEEDTAAAAFGVARPMVGVAKRTTFLIDPDGTLRKVYPKVTPKGHAAEVLAAAREIWG
jgi:thioredoxin-dependent peroxiredoxin